MTQIDSRSPTTPRPGPIRSAWQALRPQQWVKNVLVFVPIIAGHQWHDAWRWSAAVLTFAAFCLVASLGYVVNDLLDRESDRAHPRKATRPFASGALSGRAGVILAAALLAAAVALMSRLPVTVAVLAATYLATALGYSALLKRMVFVDVLTLAGLFTLRLLAGSAAAQVPPSTWLLAFCVFLFLSLALIKRYAELRESAANHCPANVRRGYVADDLPVLLTVGATSGYIAVLIAALYLSSDVVTQLYAHPPVLWAICPMLLYWITRLWFFAHRGQIDDDPLTFASRDFITYVVIGICAVVMAAASTPWPIEF